jgi:hypothetical protein
MPIKNQPPKTSAKFLQHSSCKKDPVKHCPELSRQIAAEAVWSIIHEIVVGSKFTKSNCFDQRIRTNEGVAAPE